jgi:uncharacterized protein (UPF0332 family)
LKPLTQIFLAKARDDLDEATKILAIRLPKPAARAAYYAVFHAAEAYIYEKLGKTVKTHSGVRAEFARALRDLPEERKAALRFLGRAYNYKEISDYIIGEERPLTYETARAAVEEASRQVEDIAAWLE